MVDVDLLQELLGFLHDKNPQVRTVAAYVYFILAGILQF